MKHYVIYRIEEKIYKVQVVPENKSLAEVSDLIKQFNHNEDDRKAEAIAIEGNIAEAIDFLIKDRNTDKNRLLDAVRDLKGDIDSLSDVLDDTVDYIRERLQKEDEEEEEE